MNDCSARALLGVSLPATPGQINRAYRRMARQLHPDCGGDAREFQQLVEAKRVLLAQSVTMQGTWLTDGVGRGVSARQRVRVATTEQTARPQAFGDVLAEKLAAA